jgi:peptide/nickel transport system permease protein
MTEASEAAPVFRPLPKRRSYLLRRLRKSPVGLLGVAIVGLVIFTAVFAPWIMPQDPTDFNFKQRLAPPVWQEGGSRDYILGSDQMGRDLLSRLIIGSRISVLVGISAVLVAGILGVSVGLLAGFRGGWIDSMFMRIVDAFFAVPFILMAMTIVGILGPSVLTVVVTLGLVQWQSYARVVRAEVLTLREREYVAAAHVIGQSNYRIAVRHILPNAMASVIVLATLQVAATIIAESALSFLGVGVQPPTVTWGLMLADGRNYLAGAWWLATFPGVAITITVLGIIFLGDWLRDVLDPRLRGTGEA